MLLWKKHCLITVICKELTIKYFYKISMKMPNYEFYNFSVFDLPATFGHFGFIFDESYFLSFLFTMLRLYYKKPSNTVKYPNLNKRAFLLSKQQLGKTNIFLKYLLCIVALINLSKSKLWEWVQSSSKLEPFCPQKETILIYFSEKISEKFFAAVLFFCYKCVLKHENQTTR